MTDPLRRLEDLLRRPAKWPKFVSVVLEYTFVRTVLAGIEEIRLSPPALFAMMVPDGGLQLQPVSSFETPHGSGLVQNVVLTAEPKIIGWDAVCEVFDLTQKQAWDLFLVRLTVDPSPTADEVADKIHLLLKQGRDVRR